MWTYPRRLKKNRNIRHAYVMQDGVMLAERRTIGNGRFTSDIDVYHIVPGEIDISARRYLNNGQSWRTEHVDVAHISVSNVKMLFDGLDQIDIADNNHSDAMRERGITSLSVRYTTKTGSEHRSVEWSFINSDTSTYLVGVRSSVALPYTQPAKEKDTLDTMRKKLDDSTYGGTVFVQYSESGKESED